MGFSTAKHAPPLEADGAPVSTRASIVIVSYNSRRHLERCLLSVRSTVGAACEVIVVDNASTDGSADFVAQHFPWVKLVRNRVNEGFAAATNRGVALSGGRYVVALNPDTQVTPGWLEALLAPLESWREKGEEPVGMSTACVLMMDQQGVVNTCGNTMHVSGITVCRGLERRADDPALLEACTVTAVSGACFAISRLLWDWLGGFDPSFFTYMEDTDLSLRARLAGYRCVYAPWSVVRHSYTGGFSARKLYYLQRNRLLMLLKCYRGRTLLLLLPSLLLAEALTWGYALRGGKQTARAMWRAYRWLWAHREEMCRKRAETQRLRRVSDADLLGSMAWRLDAQQIAGQALGRLLGAALNPLFHLQHRLVGIVS